MYAFRATLLTHQRPGMFVWMVISMTMVFASDVARISMMTRRFFFDLIDLDSDVFNIALCKMRLMRTQRKLFSLNCCIHRVYQLHSFLKNILLMEFTNNSHFNFLISRRIKKLTCYVRYTLDAIGTSPKSFSTDSCFVKIVHTSSMASLAR